MRNSTKKILSNNLKYTFKDPNINPIDFIGFKCPLYIFKSIYDGNITLENVEKDQIKLKSDLGYIKQGNRKNRSKEQTNATNLYELREKLSNYLIIILRICLEIFINQNKQKQDLE